MHIALGPQIVRHGVYSRRNAVVQLNVPPHCSPEDVDSVPRVAEGILSIYSRGKGCATHMLYSAMMDPLTRVGTSAARATPCP